MACELGTRQIGDAVVIDIAGRLVSGDPVDRLRNTALRLLSEGHRAIVLIGVLFRHGTANPFV